MRWWPVVVCAACGRLGFDERAPGDAAPDGPQGIEVFADFTDSFEYRSPDFVDGTATHDNFPEALCALDNAFGSPFAVIAGRALIELAPPAAPVVRDYTPPSPNGQGPDHPQYCLSANVGGLGPQLWIAAASLNGGDGLYRVDTSWQMTRDNNLNNIGGMFVDESGTFTSNGQPDLLFGTDTMIFERPGQTVARDLSDRVAELAPSSAGVVGFVFPDGFTSYTLTTFSPTTLAPTSLSPFAVQPRLAVESIAPAPYLAYGITGQRELVGFLSDGALEIFAVAEPGVQWTALSVPTAPHPLAGGVYVLEATQTLDRFRVLRVPIP